MRNLSDERNCFVTVAFLSYGENERDEWRCGTVDVAAHLWEVFPGSSVMLNTVWTDEWVHSTQHCWTAHMSLFGGLVEFPLLVSVSTVAFTFTAHQTANPSQGLLACHSWSRFVLCQRDRVQIRGTDTYAYACGDNEFWWTDITKDVFSTSARGFFGFDLGCMGASYSVCDQIAELWRNDPQVENRACIQRELFLDAAAPALRERERERERERVSRALLLLLPLPQAWQPFKQQSMPHGVNETSNLIPVRLYLRKT